MFDFILKRKSISVITLITIFFSFVLSSVNAASDSNLYVEEAYSVDKNKIEIIFSNEISEKSLDESNSAFRIEDAKDSNEVFEVTKRELDENEKNIMILTLDNDFIDGNEYKLVVLKITDIFDQNIQFGVDSEASFLYSDSDAYGGDNDGSDNNSYSDNNTNVDIELNSAQENITDVDSEDNNETIEDNDLEENANLAGINLNAGDVENQVEVVANTNEKLPTAGAEHIIVLLLALVLGAGILFFTYRKA